MKKERKESWSRYENERNLNTIDSLNWGVSHTLLATDLQVKTIFY